jgi:DNA repair exonuclease SbcCD ATPase subunit
VKLLGLANSRFNYSIIDNEDWKEQLSKELTSSGLPQAIRKLTTEIVDRGRFNALLSEGDEIFRQLRKINNIHQYVFFVCTTHFIQRNSSRRKLLEARRTLYDYNEAKRAYEQVRGELEAALNVWDEEEHEQMNDAHQLLARASSMISQKAYGFINKTINKTLQDWQLGGVHVEDADTDDRSQRGPSYGEMGVSHL